MKIRYLALLLALAAPAVSAAPERVADVLRALETRGYASPAAAVARLQAAEDAGDPRAPIDQRRRYYAALARLAQPGHDTRLLQQAQAALDAMARQETCGRCFVQWMIGEAQAATLDHQPAQARARLDQAARLIAADDTELQLELARARVAADLRQGTLDLAFRDSVAALKLAEATGNQTAYIEVSNQLAVIDTQLGALPAATEILQRARSQAKAVGFTAALAMATLNQGYLHDRLGQHAEQGAALQQALALTTRTPGLNYLEVFVRGNLSDYYLDRGELAAALQQAHTAAELARGVHDLRGEAVAMTNVGIATLRNGQTEPGLATLRAALALARQDGDLRNVAGISRELVKALQGAGLYQEALQTLEAAEPIHTDINRQSRDNALLELQARYDDQRKNVEIERLATETRIRAAQADARQARLRLWAALAAIVVLCVTGVALRLLRTRRANRRLRAHVAQLSAQSSRDALTGACNRRQFASLIEAAGNGQHARIGLVVLDVDRFKRINDHFGHAAGDRVLQEITRRLQALVRKRDTVVRWGGEEFVLVLPEAAPESLPGMAERLLDAVTRQPIPIGTVKLQVSISAGCVVHPLTAGSSADEALKLADLAMYRSKQKGRNRATCVTAVTTALPADLTEAGLRAAVRAGAVSITEIAGPVGPHSNPSAAGDTLPAST